MNEAVTRPTGHELARRLRIVLVEPNHPGNIGGAARAMKVMGLTQLALIRPQRYPDPQAEWRAAGALDVLDGAQLFDSVAAAVADCQLIIGTSTRSRSIPWPEVDARGAAPRIHVHAPGQRGAIQFGREARGLTNDELQRCHVHLLIPANPDYPSLNLAMAVQIVCYELYQYALGCSGETSDSRWDREAATSAQLEALIEHWDEVLAELDYLDPDNPGKVMTRFRRLFTRLELDETEAQMLRGFLSHVQHMLKSR